MDEMNEMNKENEGMRVNKRDRLKNKLTSVIYGNVIEHPLKNTTSCNEQLHPCKLDNMKGKTKETQRASENAKINKTVTIVLDSSLRDFIYMHKDLPYVPDSGHEGTRTRVCDPNMNDQLSDAEAWHVRLQPDIMIRVKDDTFPCDITGACFVPYDNLVVTDYANRSVKLLDTKHCCLKSVLKVKKEPWSVAYNVDSGEIAVSVPNEGQIYILRIEFTGKMVVERKVSVEKQCRGLAFHCGNIIVSYGHYKQPIPGKIQILDVDGADIKTIEKNNAGERLFSYPSHLAVSQDQKTLYVTDFKSSKVSAIDLYSDGKHVDRVVGHLQDPRGVVVDGRGNSYVCDYTSGSIHVFNDKLEAIKVLPGTDNNIVNPRSIAYDPRNDSLFVGMFYNRFVRVFEMQHSKWDYYNEAFIM